MTAAGLFLAGVSWFAGTVIVLILGAGIVATLVHRVHGWFTPNVGDHP